MWVRWKNRKWDTSNEGSGKGKGKERKENTGNIQESGDVPEGKRVLIK